MNIICKKNNGYKWTFKEGLCIRGYLFENQDILRDDTAIQRLAKINSYDEFKSFLRGVYGTYAIIIKHDNELWAAVDIARSMPLYFSTDLEFISDNVDSILKQKGNNPTGIDKYNVLEMYATSFVSGDRTIFREIKQIDIGCSIRVKEGNLEMTPYFIHTNKIAYMDRKSAIDTLERTTSHTLERIKKVIDGRPVVISLSGGYDSRYLACSLKKNGFDNVICYTYGKSDSFEPKQSKKVADALGYEWHCVSYDDIPRNMLVSEEIQDYYNYSRNYDYISYIQNYYAFKKLVDKKLIPQNAVVLTGLCNDMPTGFYTPDKKIAERYGYSIRGCAEYLYDMLYIKFRLSEEAKTVCVNRIEEDLKVRKLKVEDYESFIKSSDCVNTGYSHSRCFLHMNDVHEYFGHEWLIPCWDKDLLKFWYSMPAEFRIKQNLYETYITEYIGKKYGVGTKKYIRAVAKTEYMKKLIRNAGSLIVKPALSLGIPIKRKTDINNFSPQEVSIYKSLKNRKAIKSKYAALTLMLTVYFLDYRHGAGWYKQIKDFIIE